MEKTETKTAKTPAIHALEHHDDLWEEVKIQFARLVRINRKAYEVDIQFKNPEGEWTTSTYHVSESSIPLLPEQSCLGKDHEFEIVVFREVMGGHSSITQIMCQH